MFKTGQMVRIVGSINVNGVNTLSFYNKFGKVKCPFISDSGRMLIKFDIGYITQAWVSVKYLRRF